MCLSCSVFVTIFSRYSASEDTDDVAETSFTTPLISSSATNGHTSASDGQPNADNGNAVVAKEESALSISIQVTSEPISPNHIYIFVC